MFHLFCLFPKLRPLHLDNFALFCSHYRHEGFIRGKVLKSVFVVCPTLIQRLYQTKCFTKDEIRESLLLFFKNEIEVDDFNFVHNQYSKEYWNEKELTSLYNLDFSSHQLNFV